MFCKQCGKEISDGAESCIFCGQVQAPPVKIQSYLPTAIVTTICCCLPFGIVAIVYAARVSSLLRTGDIVGAQEAASKAKMWSWIAFGVGIITNGIYVAIQILGAFAKDAAA